MSARLTTLHRLEDLGAGAALALFRSLSFERASGLGGRLARAIGPHLGRIEAGALERIAMALPDLGERDRRDVLAASWDNLGRTIAEFSHYADLRAGFDDGRITVEGGQILADLKAAHRSAIFISGHFANWEVMQLSLIHAGLDGVTVYRAANNPLVDARIRRARAVHGGWDLAPKGREGAKLLIRALKEGRSICMLADQKMNDGIPAPLFGRMAMTAPAAAELSLRFGVPIIPGAIERVEKTRFRVIVGELWEPSTTGDKTADVLALTSRINRHLEERIRAAPGQWLWQHNRWPRDPKLWPAGQPAGEPGANSPGSS